MIDDQRERIALLEAAIEKLHKNIQDIGISEGFCVYPWSGRVCDGCGCGR